MSDYSELKRLATALIAHEADSFYLPCTVAFERAATPAVVLTLIAELDNFKAEVPKWTEREIKLIAENEALRKDAERYRWLRDPDHCEEDFLDGPADNIVVGACGGEDILWSDQLDAAIDAAMTEAKP